jgi:hypothetical protein
MAQGDTYTMLLPRKVATPGRPADPEVVDYENLREVIRQLWRQLAYLEGRLGPVTLRDSVTVLGLVTTESPEPTFVSIDVDPYVIESEAVRFVFADATSAAISVYLPAATEGKTIWVKKTDAGGNSVFVLGQNNALVDGAASVGLSAADPMRGFVGDGSDWWSFTS